jgi:hypothetical protein
MDLDDLPDDAEVIVEARRQRYYRDDAVRWVWILYGLAQASVTMLMAFSVIDGTTVAAVVTAVALIIYVGVNEILVRPYRSKPLTRPVGTPPDSPPEPADEA